MRLFDKILENFQKGSFKFGISTDLLESDDFKLASQASPYFQFRKDVESSEASDVESSKGSEPKQLESTYSPKPRGFDPFASTLENGTHEHVISNKIGRVQLCAVSIQCFENNLSVNHLIVAPKSLSESTVGAFTRALFQVRPALAREDPAASKIQKPDTDKDAPIPAHPGAAAYIDGNERTFLDKYSDYFWGAILLFSVLGSIAEALDDPDELSMIEVLLFVIW